MTTDPRSHRLRNIADHLREASNDGLEALRFLPRLHRSPADRPRRVDGATPDDSFSALKLLTL